MGYCTEPQATHRALPTCADACPGMTSGSAAPVDIDTPEIEAFKKDIKKYKVLETLFTIRKNLEAKQKTDPNHINTRKLELVIDECKNTGREEKLVKTLKTTNL